MWPFTRKKTTVTEVWRVPRSEAEEFCTLYDRMTQNRTTRDRMLFWTFVERIVPEKYTGCHATVDFIDHYPHLEVEVPITKDAS